MLEDKPAMILIADDSEDMRDILSTKLSASGFGVQTAGNGREAIEKIKELKPDLVILDVHMPEMDGVEALLKIQENAELKKTRCVFFTSYGDDRHKTGIDEKVAKEIGAVDYIRKTDDLDSIVTKIREILEHKN